MKKTKIIILLLTFIFVGLLSGCEKNDYKTANEMMENGEYMSAMDIYISLGDYEDSSDKINECKYKYAVECMNRGDYEQASCLFEELGSYNDSVVKLQQAKYGIATVKFAERDYASAAEVFENLGDYEDAAEKVLECRYLIALNLFEQKDYESAKEAFDALDSYKDPKDKGKECRYMIALAYYEAGDYKNAIKGFSPLGKYQDAQTLTDKARTELQKIEYSDVISFLVGNLWFIDSKSSNAITSAEFTDEYVSVKHWFYDGDGANYCDDASVRYTISDNTISFTWKWNGIDNETETIQYIREGSSIKFGEGKMYSVEEVEEALQGYWTLHKYDYILGAVTESEYNLLIDDGKMVYEHADVARYFDGYYYYGPYEGTYKIESTGLVADIYNDSYLGFVIGDDGIVPVLFDHEFVRGDGFPGEDGYSFLFVG